MLLLVSILLSIFALSLEECPFARIRNPGLQCGTEVEVSDSNLDYLVQEIHANNPPDTCVMKKVECDKNSKYRSYSGFCNNLVDPSRGGQFSLFPRKIPNAYADGISTPRTKALSGNPLPNPRRVSIEVNYLLPDVESGSSWDHNHFLALFGQYLGHDLTYTALIPAVEDCRECDTINPECMPIHSLFNDSKFDCDPCQEFTRSADGNTNVGGERNQINQVSSYLDASNVYGSDTVTASGLKEGSGGRLLSQGDGYLLPQENNGKQCSPRTTETCFKAGDNRNGENAGLASIHTLFMMEHNRIADFLAEHTNNAWTNEQYFQEARRIVIAQYQHIVYAEYLPNILSDEIMTQYGLKEESGNTFYTGYDENVDATPFNEFSTAGYRFGHSIVTYRVDWLTNDTVKNNTHIFMDDNWYNVARVKENNYIPIGICENTFMQSGQRRDKHFVFVMHHKVLEVSHADSEIETPPFDINALNIQRGRDHGLGGYNAYRTAYGLPTLSSFEDLLSLGVLHSSDNETVPALKKVYEDVNDIDLFTGTTVEKEQVQGTKTGILGDVAQHIVAEQFQKLKKGDRYFYSSDSSTNPGAFTPEQLAEIRRVGLASLACEHLRSDAEINRYNPFWKSNRNYCNEFPKLNLFLFLSPTAYQSEVATNISYGYELDDFTDAQRIMEIDGCSSIEWCDNVCRNNAECIAYNYWERKQECELFRDYGLPAHVEYSYCNLHFGIIPPKNALRNAITPLLETNIEDKETYTLTDPRCILEKNGTQDVGATFYQNV